MHTPSSDVYIYTASRQMIYDPSGPQRTAVTALLSFYKLLELCTCTAAGLSVRCKTVSQGVSRQYCRCKQMCERTKLMIESLHKKIAKKKSS